MDLDHVSEAERVRLRPEQLLHAGHAPSRQSVREYVVMSGDSVGDPLEVENVLEVSESSGHSEPIVDARFSTVEEEAAALIVSLALVLRAGEHTGPQVDTDQVGDEFQLINVHGQEVSWDIAMEELLVSEVNTAKARTTTNAPVSAGIQSDVVDVAGEGERGDPVPVDQSILPPLQVSLEA